MNEPAHLDSLSPEVFLALSKELNGIVIDVRSPQETAMGKLTEDALELNIYNPRFIDQVRELDPARHYFVYCATGNRSKAAKQLMDTVGCKYVVDLDGGIARALREGY